MTKEQQVNPRMSETLETAINPKRTPKRFIKTQIPDSILNDASLSAAISLLPSNYNFEVHKCVWRVRSCNATHLALQLPEGLLMYSLILSDIFTAFAGVTHCFILGDVTYGACCVDDLSAKALGAHLLIHYGHSCLVPVDATSIPCLYVFVDIRIDVSLFVNTLNKNLRNGDENSSYEDVVIAGTIQFASAIRSAKSELENIGFRVLVPQAKPLSAGEVLGCTAARVSVEDKSKTVAVFVADGRFHLEAFMIANPGIRTFRYDPYIGRLFLEEYDQVGMRESRRKAVVKAKAEARNWGIVLGTLGRQGNPRILSRLEEKMKERGFEYTVILMSELSPQRIALFEDSVDAWIQIACPRLSIDWGEAFHKPLLTPFEAEIAVGIIPGWWEESPMGKGCCGVDLDCGKDRSSCGCNNGDGGARAVKQTIAEYPMDYYAQDGGEWNSTYMKKPSRLKGRNIISPAAAKAIS